MHSYIYRERFFIFVKICSMKDKIIILFPSLFESYPHLSFGRNISPRKNYLFLAYAKTLANSKSGNG